MNLYLFYEEDIISFSLPSKKIGNFWLTDNNGKNIVNINGEEDNWIISGSENTQIITNSNVSEKIVLKPKSYYVVSDSKGKYVLYCDNVSMSNFKCYRVESDKVVHVGKNATNEIAVNLQYLNDIE